MVNFPLAKLALITDPHKLEVLQLIARVDRNIARNTNDKAIKLLVEALKESNPHAEDLILKQVA
jgi:hypothetical protein